MFIFRKRTSSKTIILERTAALTHNQLTVESIWQPRHSAKPIGDIIARSIVASEDPLDQALTLYTQSHGGTLGRKPIHQFDYTSEHRMSGNLWHHGAEYIVAVKGAPEQVIAHCELSENERESITLQFHTLSAGGNHVVAVARATVKKPLKRLEDLRGGSGLQFIGFVSLTLTIPSTTRQLLTTAQSRGLTIYVLTGQHILTSYSTNRQLGLATQLSDVLSADVLDVQTDDDVRQLLQTTHIIAGVDQLQKDRLVKLIKSIRPDARSIDSLAGLQKAIEK